MIRLHSLIKIFLGTILLVFGVLACFGGVKKTGKVVGYEPGRVLTKKGSYQVGELSEAWQRVRMGKAVIAFYHSNLKSTLATDSFCDQAYNDSPLQSLTQHLFPGLQKTKILQEEELLLDGRAARRTDLEATLDGVPVKMSFAVIKKDWCLFDFFLVSTPENYAEALLHFKKFYQGFAYAGEKL